MAVVSVKELFRNRRSSFRDGKLTHVREWLVKCNSPTDGTAVALTANDGTRRVPPPYTGHPADSTAKLTSLDAAPHEGSDVIFVVQGEYVTTNVGMPADPLQRPPEISYGFTDATEVYFLDCSEEPKPVVNSAGDPFEQYLERETGELTITIVANQPTFNVVAMDDIKHTTNAEDVTIDGQTYAAGTLKVSPPSAQKIRERVEGEGGAIQDFVYYRVTWVVKARKAGWKDKPLDVGTNELLPGATPDAPKKLRPIVDNANLPVKRPWPLDGAGKRKVNPTDKPAELEFVPYKPVSWATLKPFQPETWAA